MSKSSLSEIGSPDAQDFHMPAEWEPHEATWLAWPHFRNDWPGKFEPIPGSMPRSSAIFRNTSA